MEGEKSKKNKTDEDHSKWEKRQRELDKDAVLQDGKSRKLGVFQATRPIIMPGQVEEEKSLTKEMFGFKPYNLDTRKKMRRKEKKMNTSRIPIGHECMKLRKESWAIGKEHFSNHARQRRCWKQASKA